MLIRPFLVAASLATVLCTGDAMAQSCRDEAGAEDAQTMVDQCLEVSPATHPPCNADNSCEMIADEIARGCGMLGEDAPDFCADYSE